MWGLSLDFWDDFAFWTLVIGSLLAGFGVALTGLSSFVSLKTSSISQRISSEKIASAAARGEEARAEAAKANVETEKLRRENLDLQRAIAPRSLEQGASSAALRAFAGQEVIIIAVSDNEARRFAGMLRVMLNMAQWSVSDASQDGDIRDGVTVEYSSGIMRSDPDKVIFDFNEPGKLAAKGLLAQLKENHVEATEGWTPHGMLKSVGWKYPERAIVIKVGFRPMTFFDEKAVQELIKRSPGGNIILNNR